MLFKKPKYADDQFIRNLPMKTKSLYGQSFCEGKKVAEGAESVPENLRSAK